MLQKTQGVPETTQILSSGEARRKPQGGLRRKPRGGLRRKPRGGLRCKPQLGPKRINK